MARASIRSFCLAAAALLILGATCRREGTSSGPGPATDGGTAALDGTESTAAPVEPREHLLGIISPHAGYEYSGAIAGWAWKQLEGAGLPGAAVQPSTGETEETTLFPAQQAGGFYPADPATLRAQVEGFLAAAEKRADIVVSPIATVILLAPSHRYPTDIASALAEDLYETPLGPVKVDTALRAKLVETAGGEVVVDSSVFREEHALEVQLPFLQVALPGAAVLPLIVGDCGPDRLARLAVAVGAILRERSDVVVVASSDMSHFFTYDEAVAFDEQNLAALAALDLETYERTGQGQSGMCGYNPVRVALGALLDVAGSAAKVERLKYANSGDVTGERDRVVGYGALALVRVEAAAGGGEGTMYTREERQALIDIAKAAVRAAARGEPYEPPQPALESLRRDGAAFVTLKKAGELRGCIGQVIATEPLYRCVAEVAHSAAVEDPRFDPVSPDEVAGLSVEISVLTAPEVVTDPETIVVGRDGLIMSRGGRRGLLLPQVPGEQGWNREQFLDGTCRKAGLPYGCWRDAGTKIERFRAIVWGETLDDILQ
jgi:AmmeMemoRadiSam system protein A/AmmeMemoRadiSam system protein B